MEGYAFYRYILEAPCSIAQRQPVHAAAYTIVGICISVKQKSTINMASTVIPAAAVSPPSIDFLMYIIKHTFLRFFALKASYQIRCVIKRTLLLPLYFYLQIVQFFVRIINIFYVVQADGFQPVFADSI